MSRQLKMSLMSVILIVVLMTTFIVNPVYDSHAFVLALPAVAVAIGVMALAGFTVYALDQAGAFEFIDDMFLKKKNESGFEWFDTLENSVDENGKLVIDDSNISALNSAKNYIDTTFSEKNEIVSDITTRLVFDVNSHRQPLIANGAKVSDILNIDDWIDLTPLVNSLGTDEYLVFNEFYSTSSYRFTSIGKIVYITYSDISIKTFQVTHYNTGSYGSVISNFGHVISQDDLNTLLSYGVSATGQNIQVVDYNDLNSKMSEILASGKTIQQVLSSFPNIGFNGYRFTTFKRDNMYKNAFELFLITNAKAYDGNLQLGNYSELINSSNGFSTWDMTNSQYTSLKSNRIENKVPYQAQYNYVSNNSFDIINERITTVPGTTVNLNIPDVKPDDISTWTNVGVIDVLPVELHPELQEDTPPLPTTPPMEGTIIENALGNWWSGVWQSFIDWLQSIIDAILGVPGAIIDWLTGAWADLLAWLSTIVLAIQALPVTIADALKLPPVSNPFDGVVFSGIWHYVTSTLEYIGAFLLLILAVWQRLPVPLMISIFAFVVILIVLGVYRRLVG